MNIINKSKTDDLTAVKALLLDMDGTLFDSELIHKKAWQQTARQFDIPLDDETYQQFIGQRFEECTRILAGLAGKQFDLSAFLKAMSVIEDNLKATGVPFKPGAERLMQTALDKKLPMGLVTSARPQVIEANFDNTPWLRYFKVVVTGEDVTNPKPAPEAYQMACQQLNIKPEETMAVEDSPAGAASAVTAGCKTFIVPDALLVPDDLAKLAYGVYTDLNEIAYLL